MTDALRIHEVAKMIGRTVSQVITVRRLDPSFPKPTVKVSRERLWRACDVIEWMERKR